jgi:hypothetical protein
LLASLTTNKSLKPLGAQCYPRLACALSVSLFMHLHERLQAAPLLVQQGIKHASSCMQNHAPYACTRHLTPASQEKTFFDNGAGGGLCLAL